jgi:cardiolipin synthase
LNAVVLGQEFGKQVQAMFDKDWVSSQAITMDQWMHRPLEGRFKERPARVWEYWL